jgi:hypothetical protein
MSLQETPPHALNNDESTSTSDNSSLYPSRTVQTQQNTHPFTTLQNRRKNKKNNSISSRTNNMKSTLEYSSSSSDSNQETDEVTPRPSITINQIHQLSKKSLNPAWEKIFQQKAPTGKKVSQQEKQYIQPKLLNHESNNQHFGDFIQTFPKEAETILFQNINGTKDNTNWHQVIHSMKEFDVDIFGFAEINKAMDNFSEQRWFLTIQKQYYLSRSVTSKSKFKMDTEYKPGGTITTVIRKWQARSSEMGQDKQGLGRWSFVRLSSKKNIVIVTAYQPCKTLGPSTTWMQQWSLLRETGHRLPDPIKCFYQDLESELHRWSNAGYEIILMIDANKHIGDKAGGIGSLVTKFQLMDLLALRHPHQKIPNMYTRGSRRINYIFGTTKLQQNCSGAGMLPFGAGYVSDHRALFIRIDMEQILQSSVTPAESSYARKLCNATPKECQKFLEETHIHYTNHNLFDCMKQLMETDEWQ